MKAPTRLTMTLALALALALAQTAPASAQSDDPQATPDDYSTGDFGRIRYVENGVTLLHAEQQAPEAARGEEQGTVNAPVFPGDTLRTGVDQRVEVQLAGGTMVRVDRASAVNFLALPDPYAEYRDNTLLQISRGTVRLDARVDSSEQFRLDTPAASIYLLGDGDFRIEVWEDGTTRVVSRRGVAEVAGDGGSVLVRGGMSSEVYPAGVPETPRAFHTFNEDAFDRWCDDREDAYRIRDRYIASGGEETYEDLPYEVRPYYGELSAYGRWVSVPTYGWVWYPYDVDPGWRPYYDGYWDYGPGGYFWVSYEPWGWAPYHYGRWTWAVGYGWCWIPGRIFGGAWVSWSWGTGYVGWAPLDYWNRPAYISVARYGYYDPRSWTFIGYENIHRRNYRRYVVSADRLGRRLRDGAVVTRPPRVAPARLARDPEARTRAIREAASYDSARVRPVTRGRPQGTPFEAIERRVESKIGRAASSRRATRWDASGGRRADGVSRSRRSSARPRPPENRGTAVRNPVDGGAKSRLPAGRTRRPAGSRRLSTPAPRGGRKLSTRVPEARVPRRTPSVRTPPTRGTSGQRRPVARTDRGRERRAPESKPRPPRRPDVTRQRVTPRREAPRSRDSRGASDRVREMYRKLSRRRTAPEARRREPNRPAPSVRPRTRTEPRKVTPRRREPQPRKVVPHRPSSPPRKAAPRRPAAPRRKASSSARRPAARPRSVPRGGKARTVRPSSSRGRAEHSQRRSNSRRRR